jgi:cytochrome P450
MRLPGAAQTFLFWRWPLSYFEQSQARYGSSFTLRATGYPPLVFVSRGEDLKAMFSASPELLRPGEGGASIMPIVGPGSFMLLDGEEHLFGRRAVLPSFRPEAVERRTEMVSAVVAREVATWPRDTPLALYPRLRTMTLEIVLRSIFGSDLDGERLRALRDRLQAMLAVTGSAVLSEPILRHGPGRLTWRRFLRDREAVDDALYGLIDERRETEGSDDVLARLMSARHPDGSRMSREQLRDNVMSIVLAGHETTAAELAWAFQLLGHNRAALRRLTEEIDRDRGDAYLTATIQEVMRHRPVFLFTIPRAVAAPIGLGGLTYLPPARMLGCIYLVHHDPALYDRPHEFRPERFLESPPGSHAWLPWGGGRKRCPGRHMAMLEMKIVLKTVLASVAVQPVAAAVERVLWRSVIATPHGGSKVVLRSRNGR